jgi:hypothetical protein
MEYINTQNPNLGTYILEVWNEKFWYMYVPIYGHLEYFMDFWYVLWPCGHLVHLSHVLVHCTKNNLATLIRRWKEVEKNGTT